MRPFNFCNECKKKKLWNAVHSCSFNNDNVIDDEPNENEEVVVNRDEAAGQHAEISEDKNENECNAAQLIGNPSQASTSSVLSDSSIENKELDGGPFEEPADSAHTPEDAQDASFHPPERKLDAGADQPIGLRKVTDAVPGPSTIRHQTIGPDGKRLYACDKCNYRSKHKGNFDSHYKTHSMKKPYVCDTCKKCFSHKENLKRHVRTHTGEKPYVCEKCGKGFAQKGTLNIHLRTHTLEKPYVCEKCGKVFSYRGQLNRHMRTHTGDKPYSCEICGKRFSHRESLDTHIRIHSGERPFPCPVCDRRFNDQRNLRRHVATHGPGRYNCSRCEQTFRSNADRNRHFLQVHQRRE